MVKKLIPPLLAVAGGVVGFGLRKWELAAAFDPETGLARLGTVPTLLLILLSVGMLALLAALAAPQVKGDLRSGDELLAAPDNTLYMGSVVVISFLFAAAGVWNLLELWKAYEDTVSMGGSYFSLLPRLGMVVLSVMAAVGLLKQGRENYHGSNARHFSHIPLLPAYLCCLWLIVTYQARCGDPVILDYVWEMFAVVTGVLGTFYVAGMSFDRPKPCRAVVSALMCVYFSLMTLADDHTGPYLLLFAAIALYCLTAAVLLLFNARRNAGQIVTNPEEETPHEA